MRDKIIGEKVSEETKKMEKRENRNKTGHAVLHICVNDCIFFSSFFTWFLFIIYNIDKLCIFIDTDECHCYEFVSLKSCEEIEKRPHGSKSRRIVLFGILWI